MGREDGRRRVRAAAGGALAVAALALWAAGAAADADVARGGVADAAEAPDAAACGMDADCPTPHGAYRVWTPADARPDRKVGAIVFLHGYKGTPEQMLDFAALRETVAALDVALIVPRGIDGGWSLPGAFEPGRDEVGFVREVVADAVARLPIDRDRVMVAGFSLGASMAWYVACAEGGAYAGYAPIAGAFWEPYVDACAAPPPEIRHVHGRADETVPMTGRSLGFATQGDVRRSFELLGALEGCPAPLAPVAEGVADGLACARRTCGGAVQELCLHDGGHQLEPRWIARAWRAIAAERGWDDAAR